MSLEDLLKYLAARAAGSTEETPSGLVEFRPSAGGDMFCVADLAHPMRFGCGLNVPRSCSCAWHSGSNTHSVAFPAQGLLNLAVHDRQDAKLHRRQGCLLA